MEDPKDLKMLLGALEKMIVEESELEIPKPCSIEIPKPWNNSETDKKEKRFEDPFPNNDLVGIEFSEEQENAIRLTANWYANDTQQQLYYVAGYSGTGKTTIIREMINRMQLSKVLFVTFTGKAAVVLNKKGCMARTIHKTFYDFKASTFENGKQVLYFDEKVRLEDRIHLIVIDEVNMVNKEIMSHILSYGIKVIGLGDPEQLGPVEGEKNIYCTNPNVFLKTIHRQAENNPIIALSKSIRERRKLAEPQIGNYGKVKIVDQSYFKDKIFPMILEFDQIICGRNDTRNALNKRIREHFFGYTDWKPRKGDKVICLRNNWDIVSSGLENIPILNGMVGTVGNDLSKIRDPFNSSSFIPPNTFMDFSPVDFENDVFKGIPVDLQDFMGIKKDKQIQDKRNKYAKFDYAYVITCHKSQGSEWGKILILDENIYSNASYATCDVPPWKKYNRWLYTALTRAQNEVWIVSKSKDKKFYEYF